MPLFQLRAEIGCTRRLVAAVAILGTFASSAAFAQPQGDASSGLKIAEQSCSVCHLVSPDSPGPAQADVPTFAEIAAKDGMTAERIAGSIVVPHPPMPEISLTRRDIGDLAAYIMSLAPAP